MRKSPRRLQMTVRLLAMLPVTFVLLLIPASVSAHVNREVGPYTFLVVLIEEPFFQDNRAGFQFWVRDHGRPIGGLDSTLHAFAVSTAGSVPLTITPRVANGFYEAEFYPGDGTGYSLRLVGFVEDRAVDESFAVTFPTYPRVAISNPDAGGQAGDIPVAAANDSNLVLVGLGLTAVLAVGGILVVRRITKH
jgi:hypothetical protein